MLPPLLLLLLLPLDTVPEFDVPEFDVPEFELVPEVPSVDDESVEPESSDEFVEVDVEEEVEEVGVDLLAVVLWAACSTIQPKLTTAAAVTAPPMSFARRINRSLFMLQRSGLSFW